LGHTLIDFIAANAHWAGPVIFVTAFGESLAFLSLVLPGTTVLMAAGSLVPSGILSFWPLLAWAIPGAILGDALSYVIGRKFGPAIGNVWPLSRHPGLLPKGIAFFARHGGKSVFIGRFLGPVRAVVPLAAGILRMPAGRYGVANVLSAVIWAPVVVATGTPFGLVAEKLSGGEYLLPGIAAVLMAATAAGVVLARRYRWVERVAGVRSDPERSGNAADRGR
jgi:membrane protein DedA with SNARE-associated domain